ncbi:MAG TPA: NAD(P)-dependent oxidoreductase [Solirubrobacteraceae bacterium]|jgi:3-hydroxyisobutyrate dehydrogenase-like beta-hydroxyacid dehydrogenase
MRERIGFLGLGMMGSRMAANLASAGFELSVWSYTPGKAQRWADEHEAVALERPREVAEHSDVVISMVVDAEQVRSILLGEDGVAYAAREGLLCVDMSTIGPAAAIDAAAALRQKGISFIDAPVTGSLPRAQAATLTIMVGGQQQDFERALPALQTMGAVIEHVGELGQGQMLKVIGNALAAANAAALAEGLVLASASGIDLDAFVKVTSAGSGTSAQLSMKTAAMRGHDYTPLFRTAHLLKDVRLCLEQARTHGVPFPAAEHARELLNATVERGHAQADYAALIESVEALAGWHI